MKYIKCFESYNKRQSVVGIIYNEKGKFLLLKRKPIDRTLADVWCLPGGKVDEGETNEEALQREFLEETNLDISNFRLLTIKENNKFVINFYKINNIVNKNLISINIDEHDEFGFFSVEELKDIKVAPITLSVLEQL